MAQKIKENPESFQMNFEIFQPWSTMIMATQLPSVILEKMIKITDEIVENKESDSDEIRPAQIEDQFFIESEILEREELLDFFLQMCRTYVVQAFCQKEPFNKEKILKEVWFTQLQSMWMVSQKDNEYNPLHIHGGHLSGVMYLKIPEYLPNRKPNGRDGKIEFVNNTAQDMFWAKPNLAIQPKAGDFFMFPVSQPHMVYPFRTPDGKGERRSASFNVNFTSKSEQEYMKKLQEEGRKTNG